MRADKIFWGVLLILFGSLFMLKNLGYISIQFGNIWKLWPLILVYWGFSALLKAKDGRPNPALYIIQLIILGVLVYFIIRPIQSQKSSFHDFHKFEYQEDDWQAAEEGGLRAHQFELELSPAITAASFSLNFGAGNLEVVEADKKLITAEANTNIGSYSFENQTDDGQAVISMEQRGNVNNKKSSGLKNDLRIALNTEIPWDLNIETGASKSKLDLSQHLINTIDISGGAASFDLKLGKARGELAVNIEAGASSIKIAVPVSENCIIETSTGLTKRSFKGFTKSEDGSYYSDGFNENSTNLIRIKLEAGVSSIKVSQY
ncbi:MAG: LiaI-LiaF-like domain-containing protein [Bacteroidia bacterium]